ncbi:hypothetical protein SNEBB_003569 [Seison nebaliae]|nr:hypothetical protein SNEBB_003569 [Seison nebaliae]
MYHQYLTNIHLEGLDRYKYRAIDTSPLSKYVMHPLWNWMVEFYPKWLAPNLITFLGFLCLIISYFLVAFYDIDYTNSEKIPSYVWFVFAILQSASHHLDGTDGKQARRTNSSSPVGELFDHGIDSWAASLLTLTMYSIYGTHPLYGITINKLIVVLFILQMTFLSSHWEKYNTGILYLPWGYDISQISMTAVLLLTSYYGTSLWHNTFYGITPAIALQWSIIIMSCIFSIPMSIYNVYVHLVQQHEKNKIVWKRIFEPLIAPILMIVCIVWYLSFSDIATKSPRLITWLIGVLFSNVACRLIVSQMTDTKCQRFNRLTITTFFFFFFMFSFKNYLPFLFIEYELVVFLTYTILLTSLHVHYGTSIISQICHHLHIRVFTIPLVEESKDE